VVAPSPLCHCSLLSCEPFSHLPLLSFLCHLSHTLSPWPSLSLSPPTLFLHVPLISPLYPFFLSLRPSLFFFPWAKALFLSLCCRSLPSTITLYVHFCHCFFFFAIVLFPLLNLFSLCNHFLPFTIYIYIYLPRLGLSFSPCVKNCSQLPLLLQVLFSFLWTWLSFPLLNLFPLCHLSFFLSFYFFFFLPRLGSLSPCAVIFSLLPLILQVFFFSPWRIPFYHCTLPFSIILSLMLLLFPLY